MKVVRFTKIVKDISDEEERDYIIRENIWNTIIEEFLKVLKIIYYFPKLKEKITLFINNLEFCQREKYDRKIQ